MASIPVDGLWRRLQHAVLPPHCLLCGGDGDGGHDLCAGCRADLLPNAPCCPRCALPLAAPAPLCGECLRRPPAFDAAFVPFVYAHPLDGLVMRLKFSASLAAGRVLSDLWLDACVGRATETAPDALVPVPLHRARLRERGYNQALELARPLARSLRIPLRPGLLARTRATPAQSNLDAKTRRRNLRDALAVDLAPLHGADPPRHVVVVDDVMTTGATLAECARALKRAGILRVDVWAIARAPKPA